MVALCRAPDGACSDCSQAGQLPVLSICVMCVRVVWGVLAGTSFAAFGSGFGGQLLPFPLCDANTPALCCLRALHVSYLRWHTSALHAAS